MKLTDELKKKIQQYFQEIDPDALAEDLISNFGFEEIFEIKNETKSNLEKKGLSHPYETKFDSGADSEFLKLAA